MSIVQTCFLDVLVRFYGKNPYGEGFVARLDAETALPDPEALRHAAERLCETNKTFPKLAACLMALRTAEADFNRSRTQPNGGYRTGPNPWDVQAIDKLHWIRRRAACLLLRDAARDIAVQADKEGWLCALIDFVEDNERPPASASEFARLKAQARKSEDGLHANRGLPMYQSLVALRTNMLERAHKDVFGD